jgi:molybdate transport system substrate-binding protein
MIDDIRWKCGVMKLSTLLRTAIVAMVLGWPAVSFAQLTVLTSGGFRAPYQEALPAFEGASGIKVTTLSGASQGDGPNTIGAQLRRGVEADLVIMSKEGLLDLAAAGFVVRESAIDLAQTPLGAAVRAGASTPDISTIAAFKQTLLAAKGITFPGSTTGIYMMKEMFPKLGVAEAIASKITNTGVSAVADGTADLALQPVSELVHAPGVRYIGPIPADVQYISVFTAALVTRAAHESAAKRMLTFLASDAVATAARTSGMEPIKRR